MTAFTHAITALFADPNMAADATWRAGGTGPPSPVRVILRAPDRTANFGDGRYITDAVVIEVRVREVARPARGNTVELDGTVFAIIGDPARDSAQLVWICEATLREGG